MATTEPKLSIETVCAITDLWRLLFERGQASDGAATLSLLSTRSANAASVFGNWIGHLRQHCEGDATFVNLINARSLLDLGLQIWDLRKRQSTDHELFNSHCLLPGSMLLRLLSVVVNDNSSSRKRKQGGVLSDPETSYVHALEACIARHTILPARATFSDRDQKKPQRSQKKGVAEEIVDLEDTLNAIGQALVRDSSANMIEVVPLLFDIALRAVPTPTPRHRIQERPWLEKVFSTLRTLLENIKESDRYRVIAEMVRRTRARGVSLPSKLVLQLANECLDMPSMEGSETDQSLAFDFLAELISLEPSAFANRVLAERVFSSVTSVNASRLIDFCKTRICLPVMRAFANTRDLNTFMELWYARLKHPDPWSLWAGLAPSFADVFGESRTADQILADIDRYSQGLSTTPLSGVGAYDELRADAIILDGILRGLQNDEVLDRAWQRIDVLLRKVFAMTDLQEDAGSSFYISLWQLLTSLYESWFPSMAQNTRSPANVAEVGSEILGSELFKLAVRQCKKLCDSTSSAQHLVACICARFARYREPDDLLKLCKKSAAALSKQPASCLSALVKYPDVLMLLDDESVVSVLDATSKTSGESMTLVPLLPPGSLGTFVDSKISSTSTMTEKKAKSKRTSNAASSSELKVLDLLSSLPLGTLTAKQRGSAIDALSNPPSEKSEHQRLETRFAAILALLQYPSEGSELLADPSVIWSLARCFGDSETAFWMSDHDKLIAFDAMSLLCKISGTIISLWLKSKAQNRDKLLKMSSLAKEGLMSCLEQVLEIPRNVNVLLAGSVIGTLETADNEFLQDFAHRDPKVTQMFSQMAQGKTAPDVGIFVLEALLRIPRSMLGDSSLNLSTVFMAEVSKKAFFSDPASFSTLQFACEARAAQLFCRYAEVDGIAMFQAIENALKRDLSGQDYYAVLKAFEARLQSESSSFGFSIIEECLKDGHLLSAQALELQRCTITALSNEDFESPHELASFEILHHVVRQGSSGKTTHERQFSLQTLRHILKDKPFMVNQFGVEETISTLHSKLIAETDAVSTIYLDICAIVGVLLTQSLGRLQGRYHLIVTLFQQLMTALFSSSTSASRHSSALSRLLQTFCNPPRIPRKRNANNLVDESRKAKAYAGQYVQYILHHYCSQILTNPPSDDTIREALIPGIWAVIEAIETNNFENGIKSLSAAMNNGERAVLRSVYEEWQRRGKWEGT
ncbi:hypothetical protein HII31_12363 [Pseudocercospora fuligena]|uniref:Nucleolar 27S pre-rRNA processing Urb2/Npa2 C-terminal domain-containing protein n=1 Tax=Pseudocercospora fuligena TaxID=685502 RepID=A0A8H6R865_9PEZI|nr:hypothetical protein HII31_12363 [Pseudocercospora fuligena]